MIYVFQSLLECLSQFIIYVGLTIVQPKTPAQFPRCITIEMFFLYRDLNGLGLSQDQIFFVCE